MTLVQQDGKRLTLESGSTFARQYEARLRRADRTRERVRKTADYLAQVITAKHGAATVTHRERNSYVTFPDGVHRWQVRANVTALQRRGAQGWADAGRTLRTADLFRQSTTDRRGC